MRKRDTSTLEAQFLGCILKPDYPSRTCYNAHGDVKIFVSGTFVPNEVIRAFRMKSQWFIHPDTLRLAGAFDFAYKKKGKFSVGICKVAHGRGDILLASVLAKALKYKYGNDVQCWFALKEEYMPILENNPFIDRMFGSREAMYKALPDVNINVDDLEFKVEKKDFEKNGKMTRNRTSIYLEQLGLHLENKTPVYVVTEKEKTWASSKLRELGYRKSSAPIIGIQLYGSNPSRTYPFMGDVVKKLKAEGKQILLLDGRIGGKYLYNLREVAALIDAIDVTVTPNSYFYHLAGAMKKRAVAVFGYTDGTIWTEDYEKTIAVEIPCQEKESKCWWRIECNPGNSLREKERHVSPCLRKVKPDAVCQAVNRHFEARKILVVLLTYNFVNLSAQMVDSIRSFHDYDIVVIDNDSTDDTAEWIKEEGLEFICKKQSVPAAWNQGLRLAYNRGYDYCLLCNNDIVLSPSYIDTVIECIQRRKVFGVTGNVINKSAVKTPTLSSFSEMVKAVEVAIAGQKAGDYSALLLSRECIEKVGKFNEVYGPRYQADEDHLLRVRLAGSDIIRTYATTFLHLLGQVIKNIPEAAAAHEADWARNTKLFKKMWHMGLYSDRTVFNNLDEIKRRNPGWKKRVLIPMKHIKKKVAK